MNRKTNLLRDARHVFLALVFSLSAAGLSAQSARAAEYVVSNLNNSGAGSLRQAIIDANASAGADTITFSVSGTITLAFPLPAISDNLTIDGSGQNVTVSGNYICRVFSINSDKVVTLKTLKAINGHGDTDGGGAILNDHGTLTVMNSTFSGNSSFDEGGAINNNGGTTTAMYSTFSNNSAVYGGAISSFGGTLNVADSSFSGNSSDYGGAIVSDDSVTVADTTFSGNSSDYGGGINNYGGTLDVYNSTFSANTATLFGGGIFTTNTGAAHVTNSTFSANSADTNGGGIFIYDNSSMSMKNTIVANSTHGGDCVDLGIFAGDLGNLIENNTGCGTPVSTADPKLGALANNGGPTQTFALLTGSPAIDAGDDATCAVPPINNADQRGETRPYGTHCDIGSLEARNTPGTNTFRSVGTYDGWILESTETSNKGGTLDKTAQTFNLGDDAQDKQYRAILSFDTASLPDGAILTKVTLKIKKQGLVGTDPFTILGGLKVDMRKPFFGPAIGLAIGDFQAAAGKSNVATFGITPVSNWYSAVLNATGRVYVNKTGTTQFRLRFTTDDNNDNGADYMKFFSGSATAASRPQLIVEYYIP